MTTSTNGPATALGALWDDDLWETLLASIARGRVIPILGPALSVVEFDGRPLTFDQFIAVELAKRLALVVEDTPTGPSLDAVVSAYLRRNGQLDDLYPKISAIVAGRSFEPPEAMLKLAEIGHLQLFVTTAVNSLMEAALNKARGEPLADSIGYVPSDMPDCDLRQSLRQLSRPTVFHLLGKVSALPEYVISDDDLLEYLVALQSDRQPVNLIDELNSHYLLVLGGNYSDWLFRLLLRLAKRQRLSEPRRPMGDREILADERSRTDPTLVGFLTNFSPQTKVFNGGAPEFIDELHRRWSERAGTLPSPSVDRRTVFISYAHEDARAARAVKAGLEAVGFRTWLDENEMVGGQEFLVRITNEINKCGVFLPLISHHTETDLKDAFFRREWFLAGERDTMNADRVQFIVPIVIDSTPLEAIKEVPARFMRKHILTVRDGAVTTELVAALRSALGLQT